MVGTRAWPLVLVARFIDRTGKGLRTSPRDVMIAADCDADSRGKAFGLHRAMDTTGAVIGPLIAAACLTFFGFGYRAMFVLAFIPAALGVLAISFTHSPAIVPPAPVGGREEWGRAPLSSAMKRFVLLYAIFAIGNSSDVFLLLRVKDLGFSAASVMLVYVFYNAVYALAATPAGWLSDKFGRRTVLAGGLVVFAMAYLGFALFLNNITAWVLFALYGFYGAATEGVAKAMVTDLSDASNRGTAMGFFHTSTGALAFVASVVAGLLWSRIGPAAPFLYGAVCALICAMLLKVTGLKEKGTSS